jgi:CBS domain-containing protein
MRIDEYMSSTVFTCRPDTNLEQAARLMWEHDCGVLLVVDEHDHVVALVTDRDLCMGAYTQGKTLAELPVGNSMSREVVSCLPSDPVEHAIRVMADRKVRRMPVVDASGALRGIVSLNDVFRRVASLRDNRLRSSSPPSWSKPWRRSARAADRATRFIPLLHGRYRPRPGASSGPQSAERRLP